MSLHSLRHLLNQLLMCGLLCMVALQAGAQEHGRRVGPPAPHGGPVAFDARYHHDHYYPRPGTPFVALPHGAVDVPWRGAHYFFHGGVWFRPIGPRWVVIAPPIGVVVPFLPSAYVSLVIGGRPYFYANGAYYVSATGGYAIVDAPPGADQALPVAAPVVPAEPAPTLITYPRNGQSAAQTATDTQECNQWANAQPGTAGNAGQFQRAFAACMDGRGYSVK